LNRYGFTLLELLVACALSALFLTGALMMCAFHRSLWFTEVRLADVQQGLIGPAGALARSLRSAGLNPLREHSIRGIEYIPGHEGDFEKITIRSDSRGREPGSPPDGDVDDPAERLVYTYDARTRQIRQNGQPFAEQIIRNPGGEPMLALDSPFHPRLAKIALTGWGCPDEREGGGRCHTETMTIKVALRNMP